MYILASPPGFEEWRESARTLLSGRIEPEKVLWTAEGKQTLFSRQLPPIRSQSRKSVPKDFLKLAKRAALYRGAEKWNALYRILWRIVHEEPLLLKNPVDRELAAVRLMERAVKRDIHKMHAFVRFRKVIDGSFVAWYEPAHLIVEVAAPFFVRRFGDMAWTIFTPDASARWDMKELAIGPGVKRQVSEKDDVEELWKDYYSSIFNPARLKIQAMKSEMPVRHWNTLPEAELIPDLVRNAPLRVEQMIARQRKAPGENVDGKSIDELRKLAKNCTACHLFKHATQTVFGDGLPKAKIVFIGEQPGDEEDIEGKPFVGPAGRLLSKAMAEVGLERDEVYITNAVKHFKFEQQGPRRLHKRPNGEEINACKFWLQAELSAINPKLVVCLGATAAQSFVGRTVKITAERGQFFEHHGTTAFITTHPSALLRMPNPQEKEKAYELFVSELKLIKRFGKKASTHAAAD